MSKPRKKKLLVLTNSFPKPEKPQWGVFIAKTLDSLAGHYDIQVLNPVPWFPRWKWLARFPDWYEFARVPSRWKSHNIPVFYPRFVAIPKLSQVFLPFFVFVSVLIHIVLYRKQYSPDMVLGFYLYPEGIAATMIGRLLKVPVMLSARGSDVNVEGTHRFKRPQIRWALKNAQCVVGVSNDLCRKMDQISDGEGAACYIPNGVEHSIFGTVDRMGARASLGIEWEECYSIVFVGRLAEIKGLKYLLKALASLDRSLSPGIKLFLVGDGPERQNLEQLVHFLELEAQVIFLGMRPHEEVPLWLTAADVFCLPSLNEGQPNVILEALSCGTPVLASRVGGIPDLISTDSGILFPPQDVKAIASVLLDATAREWDSAKIKKSVQKYNWSSTGNAYISKIDKALG